MPSSTRRAVIAHTEKRHVRGYSLCRQRCRDDLASCIQSGKDQRRAWGTLETTRAREKWSEQARNEGSGGEFGGVYRRGNLSFAAEFAARSSLTATVVILGQSSLLLLPTLHISPLRSSLPHRFSPRSLFPCTSTCTSHRCHPALSSR